MWQLNLTPFSDVDRVIATAVVEAVDERGYLSVSAQDLLETVTSHQPAATEPTEDQVELDEVEAVIHRIQQFDPPGVAARDLAECSRETFTEVRI